MARRGENIRKRRDGRWEGRYIKGYKFDGTAVYHSIYAKNYNDCRRLLQEAKAAIRQTAINHSNYTRKTTFEEAFSDWIEQLRVKAKHSTFVKYHNAAKNHILPAFASVRLSALDSNAVNHFLFRKAVEEGLSSSTLHTLSVIITGVLNYVTECGLNLSDLKIKLPTTSPPRTRAPLTEKEQRKLQTALMTEQNATKTSILLCLFTGLRIGEVCALKAEDIDLDIGLLHIRRTVQRVQTLDGREKKTSLQVTSPKTKSSIRDVPIPKTLVDSLINLKQNAHDRYLFTGTDAPLEPRTLQYRFKALLKRIGLRDVPFHTLRHTFATGAVAVGADAKVVCEILGHSTVAITLNRYVHASVDMKRVPIERLSVDCGQNPGQRWMCQA